MYQHFSIEVWAMHGLKEPLRGPIKKPQMQSWATDIWELGCMKMHFAVHRTAYHWSAYWCIPYKFTVQTHETWVAARARGIDFSRRMLEDGNQFELWTNNNIVNKHQNCKQTTHLFWWSLPLLSLSCMYSVSYEYDPCTNDPWKKVHAATIMEPAVHLR